MLRRILLILAMLLIVGLVFLLGTTQGLKAALIFADRLAGNQASIAAERVEGRLLGHFVLHQAKLKTPTLSVELNHTELEWNPGKLLQGEISINTLNLAGGKVSLGTSESEDKPTEKNNRWLPNVTLEALKISSVVVETDSNTYPIDSITGQAGLHAGILTLSNAQFKMPDLTASVAGAVNLMQTSVEELNLQWDWQPAAMLLPVQGSATLNGDAEKLTLSAALDSPTHSLVNAEINQLLSNPGWQAEFSIAQFNLQRRISAEMPDVDLQLKGSSEGNRETASIDATGSVTFDSVERPWAIDAVVPLANDSYPILAISSGQAKLNIHPDKEPNDSATFNLNIPDLARLWPGLSGQINGDGKLHGSRTRPVVDLSINGSQLAVNEHKLERINVSAQFDSRLPADGPLQVAAEIEKARIAGHQINGDLQLQGTPQDSSLAFKLTEAEQGSIEVKLKGALANETVTATIEKLLLNHPDTGQWQASQGARLMIQQGSGELSLACLERKDASICSDLTWQNQLIDTRFNIKSLQLETLPFLTQFSDYKLAGRLDGVLTATVNGTRVETLTSDVELTDGAITHRLETGELRSIKLRTVTLKGKELNGALQLDLNLNDASEGTLQANVTLPADLQLMQKSDTTITGMLDVSLPKLESFNVFLQKDILPAGKLQADIRLDGSLQAPRLNGIANLYVPLFEFGEPATVFSKSNLDLQLDGSDVSLQGKSELAGRPLILDGKGSIASLDDWHASFTAIADGIQLSDLPVISLQDDFTIDGSVNTKINIAVNNQLQVEKLDAELALDKGLLTRTFIDGEKEKLAITELRITARNEKDQVLVSGQLQDADKGRLDMKLVLPMQLDRYSETDLVLDGELSADFPNLQTFGIFLDDVTLPEGRFSADIAVDGTAAEPQLQGKASLDVPRLDITEPVIGFDDTHVNISLNGNEINVKGRSQADSRPIVLDGSAQLLSINDWNTKLKLTADSIRLDDVFGSSLQTSPELVLYIEPGTVKLSGDIVIEGSEIVIRDLSSTISPSSDIRIIGKENSATPPWRVITDLGLKLTGKNRLRVAGFDGLLGGKVQVRSETGKLASGQGALTVNEGTYRAFGATVPIRRGRLEFIGGSLDDPAIQIESRRRVEQREVGFDVTGTLQAPIVTLVSTPSMDQSEILSWLLYGRAAGDGSAASTALLASTIQSALGREEEESFLQRMFGKMGMSGVNVESDMTSGVGLSTQISPRLFIKYRVDVWEQTNRLILRYHLNQNWALEGISGDEGGADILYEQER